MVSSFCNLVSLWAWVCVCVLVVFYVHVIVLVWCFIVRVFTWSGYNAKTNLSLLYVYTSKIKEKVDWVWCVCVCVCGVLFLFCIHEWEKWVKKLVNINLDATFLLWTKQWRSYGNNFPWILFWCVVCERHLLLLLLRLCRWITRMVYGRWWWWRLYRLIGKC